MAVVTEAVELDGILEEQLQPAPPDPKRLGLEQMLVAAGQLSAGLGNLVFTLAAARILAPGDFARLTVFLGLYLVLSLPGTSLSAATALEPEQRDHLLRRVQLGSVLLSVVSAAVSPWLAPVLHLPVVMLLILAAAVPAAGLLALERGRLYGRQQHRRVVASLLAEPVVRLSAGVLLALWTGAAGGAGGVVLAAYVALEVARKRRRRGTHWREAGATGPSPGGLNRGAGWTAAAFAFLAVVQNQDLIFANAVLPGTKAGLYAALSTLGGAAAFATITLPMVLMPRAVRGDRYSLAVAVGLAGAIGAVAVAVGAATSHLLITGLFGARYAGVSHLVVPYLAAMSLLGVARVLVAERCATGAPAVVTVLVTVCAAGQTAVLALVGDSADHIAFTTLGATGGLTLVLGAERLARRRGVGDRLRQWSGWALHDPVTRVVALAAVVGLAVRLIVWRGLWLDEATSVHQVHMTFSGMLSNLRDTDVHPPLYFAVLWATVRVIGYGSMAIRVPSIIAGALIVPAVYVAGRDLWDRRTGTVAACLASVAPLVVWYSQEVRMYSMFMLFAVLAIWGQARAVRRGRPVDWAIYVLASAALIWTEYFGLFQVIAQQLFFLWLLARGRVERRRALLAGWLAAAVALILLVLPLAPFAWHQFMVNQNTGKGFGAPSQTSLAGTQTLSVYTVLANLAWAVIGYHSASIMEALVALWPLGILMTLFILGRRASRETKLVLFAAVVPAALLLAAGMEKRFLYDVRYMSGVAMALLLLGSRVITGASQRTRMQAIGCIAMVAALAAGLGDEQFNGTNPRLYDFAGALKIVDQQWRPGDALVYSPSSLWELVDYYSPQAHSEPIPHRLPSAPPGGAIFVVASPTLMQLNDTQQLQRMLTDLRQKDLPASTIHRSNVTVWTFIVPEGGMSK